MKLSDAEQVREMYDVTAESYAEMMDSEINLPVYSDVLGRLQARIANMPGTLVDTACGSGHMLSLYNERYDQRRSLLGIDLSARMVSIASKRLKCSAEVVVGDMRDLSMLDTGSASAVLNFFAIHHLDANGVSVALAEWCRVLRPGGQLVVAAWEGAGAIDYGDESGIVALRYNVDELASLTRSAGFAVERCIIEPVEDMPMDAIYLEGAKE